MHVLKQIINLNTLIFKCLLCSSPILLISCQSQVIQSSNLLFEVEEEAKLTNASQLILEPQLIKTADFFLLSQSNNKAPDKVVASDTQLWSRVRSGFKLNIPKFKRIKLQRDWYEKNQKYLNRVITRATPFLFYIIEEIEKRNMPTELILLPIVESAYDPFAYSFGRASGMWQFIPGTGKRYGLKQNWWYDGRRDVVESTRAALDYLEYLHKHFKGDWLHALAAYNSGEGNVARAIRNNRKKHKKTDFWNLNLPKETKAYVPKLLALAELLKNEESFNLKWKQVLNKPTVVIVKAKGQIDITYAAEMAEITVEEFYKLNPAFNRWSTPPKGPHHLLLPIDKAELFLKKLALSKPEDRVRWVRYKIKSGDSLIKVARHHKTTTSILKSVNHIKGNRIHAGKTLLIPTASSKLTKYSLSSDSRLVNKQNIQRGSRKTNYRVKAGDSFWKIARQYKVNSNKLAAWNAMAPKDPLRIGQKLVIWNKSSVYPAKNSGLTINSTDRVKKIRYRVRKGDSLSRISDRFAVKIIDLKRWNIFLKGKKYLQPGERLTLYVDITQQSGS